VSIRTFITFQPSEFVDHVTADGTGLTKLPYPVHVWSDNFHVAKELGGWTEPQRIVGFQRDPAIQTIDVPWYEVAADPQKAVGLYVVAANADGSMTSLTTAVRDVQSRQVEVPDTIGPLNPTPDSERRRKAWEN